MKKIAIIILLLSLILVVGCSNKVYDLEWNDYSEKGNLISFTINDEEKTTINKMLEEYYSESDVAGFGKTKNYNVYQVYGLLMCSNKINNFTIYNYLLENITNLSIEDFRSLSMIEKYYYLLTIQEKIIPLNNEYKNEFMKYMKDGLFYLNTESDLIADKLTITYLILKNLGTYLQLKVSDYKNIFLNYYNNFEFLLPTSGKTLYNAGGAIIYYLYDLGFKKEFTNLNNWMNTWISYYENNFKLDTYFNITLYRDFLNIAEIFNYKDTKLDNYYMSLKEYDFSSDSVDYYSIYNIINSVNSKNSSFETSINNYITKIYQDISFERKEINIEETFFGIMLANYTGFNYNKKLILNTLGVYINMISSDNYSVYQRITWLYYYVGMVYLLKYDGTFNSISNCLDIDELSEIIDDLFKKLSMDEDILYTRYLIETSSILKIGIKNKYKKNIEKCLKSLDLDEIMDTAEISNLYIIDQYLKLGIITIESVNKAYTNLKGENGGIKNMKEGIENIYSTFDMLKVLEFNQDDLMYDDLSNLQKFVSKLNNEGIYYDIIENGNTSLKVQYYAYNILLLKKGGNKDD